MRKDRQMKTVAASLFACSLVLGACTETVVETRVEERVDTVTITVTDTVVRSAPSLAATLVAEGRGGISGHLTDATVGGTETLLTEQRGSVERLDGSRVHSIPVPASAFGGLLGAVELDGMVYLSYTDELDRLSVADTAGRILFQTVPYDIKHFGGGLAVHAGRLLLGYGHRLSFTGPGDPRHGGVVSIDPATGEVDTVAVGLRSPFKLTVSGDTAIVSSAGEFLEEGLYRVPLNGVRPDFGYPAWEGNTCHLQDCPPRSPPWYTYPTNAFGCSAIVGGAVWGDAFFFADFCEGWLRSIGPDGLVRHHLDLPGRISGVRNLGGRLLVLGYDGGKVWEIRTAN